MIAKVSVCVDIAVEGLAQAAVANRDTSVTRPLGGEDDEGRLWEVAVLFHLREAFRSGDIWLAHSRRYGDLKEALVPAEVVRAIPRLAMPFEPDAWLGGRKARMSDALLTAAVPEEADAMVLDLYKRLPEVRVTDVLLEVDDLITDLAIRFSATSDHGLGYLKIYS